jgi:hypothetical protein
VKKSKKIKINTRVLYTLLSAILILLGSIVAIQYAQGKYRLTRQGISKETGLLAANSFPPGAQIYIDGKLVSATDDTLYLKPDTYQVEIKKDGYSAWNKNLTIQKELVTQTNAQLFPIAPSLTPLTFTGVTNLSPSADGQKIIYYTASASAQTKNGLYVMDLNNSLISFRDATQISEDVSEYDLENAKFIWSPDSSQVILITAQKEILLDLNRKNDLRSLSDISYRKEALLSVWEEEMYLQERQFLAKFPDEIIEIATTSARNVYFSPDKERIVYTATQAATLPEDLIPPVPASNTQPQTRDLEVGGIYVYDREEDRNFMIGKVDLRAELDLSQTKLLLADDLAIRSPKTLDASPSAFTKLQATTSAQTTKNFNRYNSALFADTFQWYSDSKHLLYTQDNMIKIKSYDNTNDTVLYSGPFFEDFIYPSPDGKRLMILTGFGADTTKNLYALEIR